MHEGLKQLIRYSIVGVCNTAITIIIIYILTYLNINPYLSNSLGFLAGIINSYILNSAFTFEQKKTIKNQFNFILSFIIAYQLNIITLYVLTTIYQISTITGQTISIIVYNIAFFVLMRFWVFKK